MMKISHTILLLLVVSGCSLFSFESAKTKFSANRQVTIIKANQTNQSLKLGESFEVGTDPVLLRSPGHVDVILFPFSQVPQETKVNMRELNVGHMTKNMYKAHNQILNDILLEVSEVHQEMASNQSEKALIKVNQLMVKYPKITYFKFLKASCFVVLGRRAEAMRVLESALSEYPNNAQANQLYQSLKGGGAQ